MEQLIGKRSVAGIHRWVLQFQCIFLGGSGFLESNAGIVASGAAGASVFLPSSGLSGVVFSFFPSSGFAAGDASGADFGSSCTKFAAINGVDALSFLNGGCQA